MIRRLLPILGLALLLAGWGYREQSTLATDRDPPTGATTIALPGPPSDDDRQPPDDGQQQPGEEQQAPNGPAADPNLQPSDADDGQPLTIYCRNTGDVKDWWPSYDLPLRITCEVPEVPKAIRGPFPKLPEKPDTPEE